MSVDAAGLAIAGRVSISARAYERIAAVAAADVLGVPPGSATARVTDEQGGIAAEITAAVAAGGESVTARARSAQERAGRRLTELTGATVAGVRIRITHVIESERRTR